VYKVILINNGVETIIHYPTSDSDAPHLKELPLSDALSQVDTLNFSILPDNLGYNNLYELTTKVKVVDVRDDSVRFTGRVLSLDEKMDNDGTFTKEVLCEGGLSFLNDTKVRNAIITNTPTEFVTQLLTNHNSKVDNSKKIQNGTIDVTGSVWVNGGFKTSLEVLLNVREKIGGDVRIRETNGVLYLDWLQNLSSETIDITLGVNMKDMVKSRDITSLGTRIIPLGANNLTIESVNNGLDYVDDPTAMATYGVIEKTVEYKDITVASDLYRVCVEDLSKQTQPLYVLESNALDLSYISAKDVKQFVKGANLHIYNPVMGIDSVYKIVKLDLDLLQPYDPKLTISNFPPKLTSTITDLRKSSIQNNGVYNGVQVGDGFGLRIASSDGKILINLNATEGISIQNLIKGLKVFYVDTDGGVTHDGKQITTSNGKTLIQNWKNDNGGSTEIYDINGNLNIRLGSENGLSANKGGTIVLYDDGSYNPRVEIGINATNSYGEINLKDKLGLVRACMYADSNLGNGFFLVGSDGSLKSYITETLGYIGDDIILTHGNYSTILTEYISKSGDVVYLQNNVNVSTTATNFAVFFNGYGVAGISVGPNDAYVHGNKIATINDIPTGYATQANIDAAIADHVQQYHTTV
jgi:phage minor structural protein